MLEPVLCSEKVSQLHRKLTRLSCMQMARFLMKIQHIWICFRSSNCSTKRLPVWFYGCHPIRRVTSLGSSQHHMQVPCVDRQHRLPLEKLPRPNLDNILYLQLDRDLKSMPSSNFKACQKNEQSFKFLSWSNSVGRSGEAQSIQQNATITCNQFNFNTKRMGF